MNTEINLLEKKTNKYITLLFFGAVFVLGFLLISSILWFQQTSLENKVIKGRSEVAEMEITIAEYNKKFATREKLNQIEEEVNTIMSEKVPHMTLYHNIVMTLPKQDHLQEYGIDSETSLTLEVTFKTLDEISRFITDLLEKEFVSDVDLAQVYFVESGYEASLTLDIDQSVLQEEFDIK